METSLDICMAVAFLLMMWQVYSLVRYRTKWTVKRMNRHRMAFRAMWLVLIIACCIRIIISA